MKSTSTHAERKERTERFQQAFWAAKRAIAESTGAAFARHRVHAGQQFILRCLWDEEGLAPGEIASRLGLSTPTVTKATARMEVAGLVVRRPHPTDRRLVRIQLTSRGRSLQSEIDKEVERMTERALRSLSDRQRNQLVRHLLEIRRNLSSGRRP
jgi:MarR family transcriptional regulator, organic hydroperoxide resistance regulator